MAPRMMSLGVLMHGTGTHPGSWLHPATNANGNTDIAHFIKMAQLAEAAKFDLFFIADTPAARTNNLHAWSRFPMYMNCLEPVPLLSALAPVTSRIGLGGTTSTSFAEPYNVARQFAALDHISAGRAAWNVVTSANDYAARNFGLDALPPHAERYRRAQEFVAVVQALWDTWEDDAFILDRTSGVYLDPKKQHPVDHDGEFYRIHGALNIERTPQGQPVIIQAGQSEDGREFSAQVADIVFSSTPTFDRAQAFYRDMKSRLPKFGRTAQDLKVLPGISPIVGETLEEAERKYEYLQSLVHPEVRRQFLAEDLEADLSGLPMDQPIPEERIPAKSNLHQAYFDHIVEMIRVEKLTLGEMCRRYNRGRGIMRGTPKSIVDFMEEWFTNGAADGFMVVPQTIPEGMEDFANHVVPELRRRGLFRKDYEGTTLRDHLGLARPANRHVQPRHVQSRSEAAE